MYAQLREILYHYITFPKRNMPSLEITHNVHAPASWVT